MKGNYSHPHSTLLDFDTGGKSGFDSETIYSYIDCFMEAYPFLERGTLTKSILDKAIPVLKLGNGKNNIVFVGGHHGMESVSCALLLRFVNDFCEQYQNEHSPYGVNLSYLFSTRTVYVIPLLNPDGVDICINGVDNSNPLYERLMKMNSMSEDFSHWQANARGVDLNHNYNAGFEEYKHLEIENGTDSPCATRYGGPYPESEPESAALCNFLRSLPNVKALISFHTQGEEIYWEYRGKSHPKAFSCAKIISKLTGYKVCSPENTASYSGLKDWFIEELSGLGYTLECGRGKNPLPPDDYKIIYEKLREFLFCAPILF